MKCPHCGAAKLSHDTRDLPYTYKGETTILPQVTGEFCAACGEAVFDAAESRRVSASMREFTKQVNAAIVDLLGADALVCSTADADPGAEYPLSLEQKLFLFTRSDTIYGGSNEIQRNVLAERVLGLPR